MLVFICLRACLVYVSSLWRPISQKLVFNPFCCGLTLRGPRRVCIHIMFSVNRNTLNLREWKLSMKHVPRHKAYLLRTQLWPDNPRAQGCPPPQEKKTLPSARPICKEIPGVAGVGDGNDYRITSQEHPSPILHEPRDIISRSGNPSLRRSFRSFS